ncbi:MAG: Ribosomal RNA small subunit methyltransferase G [Candidatus Ordinivivax streblomastigis]|uniref:Ribosomal RNA small subunit methyltransferase G n=1 Tax=Candidatus Ordinivivax streblomastigis TaxID=2540710 RepID=A0A5M8P162_9BACT|nr:MAG: Ribosomal RNA small subunit methyltransferase G [Candidatus Ordinivivax streblomastigis]
MLIKKYFPNITPNQEAQLDALGDLYTDWNSKINLISRKDIENLYEKHILHSLGIAQIIRFNDRSAILDVGTGGGFPGIPLAILFPKVHFLLIDSIGKKVKVAEDVARQIGLNNVECLHERAEAEKRQFDFIVSRAVMPLPELVRITRKNIARKQQNALPNGFLCLKGGDLQAELHPFKNKTIEYELSDYFEEEFFLTKKVVFLPIVV